MRMKLLSDIRINGKLYPKGSELPWDMFYSLPLINMLVFGTIGFLMAYSEKSPPLHIQYLFGGLGMFLHIWFYLKFFGRDEVKWMFINSGLGFLGIYSQIGWLLSLFGKKAGDYPYYVHAIPFLYYVLCTFLIRHAVLEITQSREKPAKKKLVENCYIAISVAVYLISYCFEKRS